MADNPLETAGYMSQSKSPDAEFLLGPGSRIHMVGIAGAGMSGLAKILAQQGFRVSGSDLRLGPHSAPLLDLGIDMWSGHQPDRASEWDVLVTSSAVPTSDPEVRSATLAGVEIWARPDLLEAMTRAMPAIGISGTHGKTSSSALAVAALRAMGHDPSYMVGGRLTDLATNAHLGDPALFVLEADEAFGTFLRLNLKSLLVTNVEADHLDFYEHGSNVLSAFQYVAASTDGPVIVCADDEGAMQVWDGAITYGQSPAADWQVGELSGDARGAEFGVRKPSGEMVTVRIPKPGLHMALNATGVMALLSELGFDAQKVAEGFGSFAGVHRRYEHRGSIRDVELIDDYAHHPTEIAATIKAARAGHPNRLVAVFQPHRYTRTAEHATGLGAALVAADVIVVTDVYAAHELPIPGVSGASVVRSAEAAGKPVVYEPSRAGLARTVADLLEPGDRVLTLGAGDITQLPDELLAILS
ncbi:MAG: UDP-N-acetylmuramate--L-alanine ligase [Acidimicrobiia bacterium]|nr:UDP-N-acetylmuramate--L-alanine ligase [Acidimicrobiia bacterium]